MRAVRPLSYRARSARRRRFQRPRRSGRPLCNRTICAREYSSRSWPATKMAPPALVAIAVASAITAATGEPANDGSMTPFSSRRVPRTRPSVPGPRRRARRCHRGPASCNTTTQSRRCSTAANPSTPNVESTVPVGVSARTLQVRPLAAGDLGREPIAAAGQPYETGLDTGRDRRIGGENAIVSEGRVERTVGQQARDDQPVAAENPATVIVPSGSRMIRATRRATSPTASATVVMPATPKSGSSEPSAQEPVHREVGVAGRSAFDRR